MRKAEPEEEEEPEQNFAPQPSEAPAPAPASFANQGRAGKAKMEIMEDEHQAAITVFPVFPCHRPIPNRRQSNPIPNRSQTYPNQIHVIEPHTISQTEPGDKQWAEQIVCFCTRTCKLHKFRRSGKIELQRMEDKTPAFDLTMPLGSPLPRLPLNLILALWDFAVSFQG